MAGTLISFQGVPASKVALRLSRGWTADKSQVLIEAKNLPAFKVILPEGEELAGEGSSDQSDLSVVRGSVVVAAHDLSDSLSWEGVVLLGEVVEDGDEGQAEEWTHATRRYIVGVETIEQDGLDGSTALLRLMLTDQRFFWGRGLIRRWFFNYRDPDGNLRADSLKAPNQPWTLAEIVRDEIVARLFRHARLSAYPAEWDALVPPDLEFPPFCTALEALRKIVRDYGLEEPCLRWDDTVALYLPGQGKVGYAQGSIGGAVASGPNVIDEFERYKLDEDGTGQGFTSEPGYPETHFAVVGGQRVMSVAVDDLEPIFVVGEKAYPLDEKNIRKLTKGKYGLDWLRQWILAPNAYKVELPDAVSEVLRTQAYRFFRIPGVRDAEGRVGPNFHLLPMLPRAEQVGGKRLPVTVESYRFTSYQVALWNNAASLKVQTATRELARIREDVDTRRDRINLGKKFLANFRQIDDPFAAPAPPLWDFIFKDGKSVLNNDDALLDDAGRIQRVVSQTNFVRADELAHLGRFARQVERLKASSEFSAVGPEYEKALLAKFAAEDELSGSAQVELYQVAKESIAVYEAGIRDRVVGGDYPPEIIAKQLALQERIRDISGKLDRNARDRANKIAGGERPDEFPPQYQLVYRNLPRQVDGDAQVINADEGWIRTSRLALHLTHERVAQPQMGGPGLPCPVRVVFGSVVRPPANVVQGTQSQATGDTPDELQAIKDLQRANPEQVANGSAYSATEQLVALLSGGSGTADAKKPSAGTIADVNPIRARALLQIPGEIKDNVVCPGAQTFVPIVATDQETNYVAAFVRKKDGSVARIDFDAKSGEWPDFNWTLAVRLAHPELVELVKLDGTSNRDGLDRSAAELVRAQTRRPEVVTTTKHKLGRPLPFQPDGLIESVEIESDVDEDGGPCGFTTTVRTGSSSIFRSRGTGGRGLPPLPPRELDGPRRAGGADA